MNLNAMQESYLKGLRQITGLDTKRAASASAARPGLGNRSKQQQGKEYAYFNRGDQLKQALDISNKAMLASCLFWILLVYLFYFIATYGLVALRVMFDDADLEGTCQAKFSADAKENQRIIEGYPKGDAGPYLARFASDHTAVKDYPLETDKLPPFVTAVSSSEFFLLQGFIGHIRQVMKAQSVDVKLIVYDIGLYKKEREILQRHCDCDVRSLDYSVYPDHVWDTQNFAWRPLVIQTLLEEFGAVMYVDVTTRFKTSNSVNFVRSRGSRHFLLWDKPIFSSTVAYTNKKTFLFLNESRCLFSETGLVDSQLMVFYRTNHTWHSLMKPWLTCALNAECIAPRWSRQDSCLHFRRPKTTGCHAYDMSVLSIILNRGVQMTLAANVNRFMPPRVTYISDDEPALFEEQPWTYNQLLALLAVPFLFFVLALRRQLFSFLSRSMLKQ